MMRDNWDARAASRVSPRKRNEQMTFEVFAQRGRRGWEAFGTALRRDIEGEVSDKESLPGMALSEEFSLTETIDHGVEVVQEDGLFNMDTALCSNMAGSSSMEEELPHFWMAMDWRFMDPQGW